MPNITFSSPIHKDKTVYAVAGSHTQTILKIAKENHVPIDFSCEDGECATCMVKVTPLGNHGAKTEPMASRLTDKELVVLREHKKITSEDIERMRVEDVSVTPWRLACQMILRDEDLLVEY
ncbi:2Fe-2S iron-sulfur cluster binding domain-containing protein [Azoarcus communis]|jgi:ferredoxin|uniref:Ferredoxin n=1 Tax=Parazoarcus communis SWub3 = DSM 12120 TaxID=1121029 RepID=A0A323V1N1_9RHOO|nr:2Fe-2S iron-sulfur cluster-binding protein [Parazoarcus communis]NMG49363.1 2Fe-2S iron-sulfur cluster binding domain-containing protein [Parazoarcus communis]NMG69441.1 2Fe-2S iron-sulfur cluster binding domain-containing protein [Parazoarcus communis SWub3 = DSM 12120]PZA17386.1 ferredoxin [Azoarcus communis] [Parazoarcus communis SWub3 = DSM 12120]